MAKNLTVSVSEDDFSKKEQPEQMRIIYGCLLDMQDKTKWRWKQILGVGAAAGFAGGLLREKALPFLIKLF